MWCKFVLLSNFQIGSLRKGTPKSPVSPPGFVLSDCIFDVRLDTKAKFQINPSSSKAGTTIARKKPAQDLCMNQELKTPRGCCGRWEKTTRLSRGCAEHAVHALFDVPILN